jgi:hypothetical protein
MSDLIQKIQDAQRNAGEQAVMDDLRAKGLLTVKADYVHPVSADIEKAGNFLQTICHTAAFQAGWWNLQGNDIRNESADVLKLWVGTKLMLVVSEVAEAMEGHRKNLMDDKLPHRKMLEVELADAVIRCFDLAGGLGFDLGGAIAAKLAYNAVRPDHKAEVRAAAGGKAY